MKFYNKIFGRLILLLFITKAVYSNKLYDLSIIGEVKHSTGIGRLPIGLMEYLTDSLEIKFNRIPGDFDLRNVPDKVRKILIEQPDIPSKVAIFFDILWIPGRGSNTKYIPKSDIKIAYSMFESTLIPPQWVSILNTEFDAVVVPDEFLVSAYLNSGVMIPIFVLPCPLYLDEYLNLKSRRVNQKFTFGISSAFWQHKNHELLLNAFLSIFRNNNNVRLILHGRGGQAEIKEKIQKKIREFRLSNVVLIDKELTKEEHIRFITSLHCYVLLSKGEGFSITPREALAAGIPCIISNALAHKTIADTGFVRAVESNIVEPAYYAHLGNEYGYQFNCTLESVKRALVDVYRNYLLYLKKAAQGRKWVRQYSYNSLKTYYLSLVHPKAIYLGNENKIYPDCIVTNSNALFEKYKMVFKI